MAKNHSPDQPVQIVICPGIHPPALTRQFVQAVSLPTAWIYPAPAAPAYSAMQILAFLLARTGLETPLLLIGFSAGVVGAVTAANLWQALGGRVVALLAFDGWGMPLRSQFPVHRFSHDPFTHWSSALLDTAGVQPIRFYADPPVGHLNLWRAPQMTQGWAVSDQAGSRQGSGHTHYRRSNAAELVRQIIADYSPDQIT
ncbi:MAG: hypothetical protein KME07_13580 [Pegethrix bostrychoides GSE-TBD4-15B]|uniref:Alpha/beta hydrolase n=1 Tax=Pegethrix bostrychoides GSE-TBD4-15B TaxID=2839662 RepID=A0A951PC26_9CYAN|nr:hypothetical protein [Pegethrix bostrychoides GSE-TBD4-15B]